MSLERFLEAQDRNDCYAQALAEVRAGLKRTHWMWFIFPQLRGLGRSATADFFGLSCLDEAQNYLRHPTLGPRLIEIAEAAISQPGDAASIFGSPDDMKLRSCATLFAAASPSGSVFHRLLDRFFAGRPDPRTLEMLGLSEVERP